MVPYRGRMALRVTRVALAFATLGAYPFIEGARISANLAFLVAYAVFGTGTLYQTRFDNRPSALAPVAIDAAFFAYGLWLLPLTWLPALTLAYLLTSAAILQPFPRVILISAGVMVLTTLR